MSIVCFLLFLNTPYGIELCITLIAFLIPLNLHILYYTNRDFIITVVNSLSEGLWHTVQYILRHQKIQDHNRLESVVRKHTLKYSEKLNSGKTAFSPSYAIKRPSRVLYSQLDFEICTIADNQFPQHMAGSLCVLPLHSHMDPASHKFICSCDQGEGQRPAN